MIDAVGGVVGGLVLAGVVGVGLYEWLAADPAADSVAAAHAAYREGRIDEAELERRLELAVDPEADRIRAAVEPVTGVGPELSAALALRFDTVEDLEDASRAELEQVPGIGPTYAEALRERFE